MDRTLRELVDRHAIGDLLNAYSLNMDLNRPAAMRELFTDDCVVDFLPTARPLRGPDELVQHLTERLRPVKATSHHLSNCTITFEGDDRATGTTYLYAWHAYRDGRPDGHLWGQYHDVFVRTAGGWRIEERRLLVAGTESFDRPAMRPLAREP